MYRVFCTVVLAGSFVIAAAEKTLAVDPPASVEPGLIERRFQTEERPAPTKEPVITTPAPEEAAPQPGGPTFTLHGITLKGATVFTEADTRSLYEKKIGAQVMLGDVRAIADAITARYRNAGYILTRAIVPPQKVNGNPVTIQIVEGFVDEVEFQGGEKMNQSVLNGYAEGIKASRPLKNADLERYLLLLDDLSGAMARGVLSPSPTTVGASRLTVTIDYDAVDGEAGADNRGSRFLGPIQLHAQVAENSGLGLSERLQARSIVSGNFEELRYYEGSYAQPVGGEGTLLRAIASYTDTAPGASLEPLDVEGTALNFSLAARHPFLRSRRENLYGDFGLRYRDSSSDVLSTALYDDHIRHLYVGGAYDVYDRFDAVNRLDAELVHGLDVLGANDASDLISRANADPTYTRMEATYTRLQRLTDYFSAFFGLTGQYAFDSLYASEEFTVGGEPFGSAYDPAEITGDHGMATRLEMRYSDTWPQTIVEIYQLYTFYDYGKVWNRDAFAGEPKDDSLASAGVGARFSLTNDVAASVEVAKPLTRDVSAEGSDGDDIRGFFALSYVF